MSSSTLEHKEPTIQDLLDKMTSEQKDLQALIIGAAIEGEDLSGNPDILRQYDELPGESKLLINFVVGTALDDDMAELSHGNPLEVDNFLAHFGVKGMRWGIRKSEPTSSSQGPRLSKTEKNNPYGRREARDTVKRGGATLEQAHLAGLKSTGHRALNFFTGDKRYWMSALKIAGVATAGVVASSVVPGMLPVSFLTDVGVMGLASLGIPPPEALAYTASLGGKAVKSTVTSAQLGEQALSAAGIGLTTAGAYVAATVASTTNALRAVRGNARINKSYDALGKDILKRQTEGTERVQKTLNRSGSIRKKNLKHDGLEGFLSHYGSTPLSAALKGS